MAMLLENYGELPDNVMVEAFLNTLSIHDASVVRSAFQNIKKNAELYPSLKTSLIGIFSGFDCQQTPSQSNLTHLVTDIANHQFLRKPSAFITDIHAGIPSLHVGFWKSIKCGSFLFFFKCT